MQHFLTPYNPGRYDAINSFLDLEIADWTIKSKTIQKGDLVYFYASKPIQAVNVIGVVVDTNIDGQYMIDDKKYYTNPSDYDDKEGRKPTRIKLVEVLSNDRTEKLTYEKLSENGLKGYVQSTRILENNIPLLNYITQVCDKQI